MCCAAAGVTAQIKLADRQGKIRQADRQRRSARLPATRPGRAPGTVTASSCLEPSRSVGAVLVTDVVEYADVRMIQTGDGFGFTLEALLVGGIGRKPRRKNLDGHHTFQPGIPSAIHFAHAARAQRPDNLIRTKPVPSR